MAWWLLFHSMSVLRPPRTEVTLQALQACLIQEPPDKMHLQRLRIHGWVDSQLEGRAPDVAPEDIVRLCGCGHVPGADVRVLQAVARDSLRATRPVVTTTIESEQLAATQSQRQQPA